MGYYNCYKRYMAGLGYPIMSNAKKGAVIVEGVEGNEINTAVFVSIAMPILLCFY